MKNNYNFIVYGDLMNVETCNYFLNNTVHFKGHISEYKLLLCKLYFNVGTGVYTVL